MEKMYEKDQEAAETDKRRLEIKCELLNVEVERLKEELRKRETERGSSVETIQYLQEQEKKRISHFTDLEQANDKLESQYRAAEHSSIELQEKLQDVEENFIMLQNELQEMQEYKIQVQRLLDEIKELKLEITIHEQKKPEVLVKEVVVQNTLELEQMLETLQESERSLNIRVEEYKKQLEEKRTLAEEKDRFILDLNEKMKKLELELKSERDAKERRILVAEKIREHIQTRSKMHSIQVDPSPEVKRLNEIADRLQERLISCKAKVRATLDLVAV
jgi:chromosome segregation ATPase